MSNPVSVAFFSLEIGLTTTMPNYAGGLGILAGDMLKSAADLNLNVVGVSLLYSKGIFQQAINSKGEQTEFYLDWQPKELLKLRPEHWYLKIDNRPVKVQIWEYHLSRADGQHNPIYFLDTNCPENHPEDRLITSELYPSDEIVWLKQQIVLGLGGVQALQILGYPWFDVYHLNESHDMFVLVELRKQLGSWEKVKAKSVITVHTPLPGAHKIVKLNQIKKFLGPDYEEVFEDEFFLNSEFNQTEFAIHFSKYANGVAIKHGITTQQTYPQYTIEAVTNGIHPKTWTNPYLQEILNQYIPDWAINPANLRLANRIPANLILEAHKKAKIDLIEFIAKITGEVLDAHVFTIAFARRKVPYKRANLIFSNLNKLNQIAEDNGGLQLVFSGKAWPTDMQGKQILKDLFDIKKQLSKAVKLVFIPNYNITVASKLVAGVDLWLNTPLIPWEASGTSGMKANLNGIPNFSVLDGWWLEGWLEGVTGWAIGDESGNLDKELTDLYEKLEKLILPTYHNKSQWVQIMINCIAINGSYFNTHRVMLDYLTKAYSKTLQENYYLVANPRLVSILENTLAN